jgi:SAM-dependent methyltransferase
MRDDPTLRFYAERAAAYAAESRTGPAARLGAFLDLLPAGALVLELGCGNGQDAAAMLARGFRADPTDGSPEMAAQASARLGRPVRVMPFDALDAEAVYDAVWAHACLLHVPWAGLPGVLRRIRRALKPGGLFEASYKGGAGAGEGRDRFGRYYSYPDRESLTAAYALSGDWSVSVEEGEGKGYDGIVTPWLHVRARRP